MKTLKTSTLLTLLFLNNFVNAAEDPVEKGLRAAFKSNTAKEYSQTITTLREVIKLLEEKNAKLVADILPEKIDFWQGGEFKREDMSALGGGLAVTRTYTIEKKSIQVKVVKDSPLADKWLKILGNKNLLALSGKETKTISGQTGIIDGNKISIILDDNVLLEVTGSGEATPREVMALARDLDMIALKKLD